MTTSYPCPCCGHLVFGEPPGSYDICSICLWEDDLVQLRFPFWQGGANKPSLVEAQANFRAIGACESRLLTLARPPRDDEPVEPGWRPFDPEIDNAEVPVSGTSYGQSYPDDLTTLYYWRPTYWRRPPTA